MKILATGCGGFVAPYVIGAIRDTLGPSVEILGTHRRALERLAGVDDLQILDVNDAAAVNQLVAKFRPDHFVHLAAVSHVPTAIAHGHQAWCTNLLGTLNCARAVLQFAEHASFIFASSGQVYAQDRQGHTEDCPVAPISDYGATKAAADIALGALAARGLRAIRLRLYNHIGPGQAETFVVPSFAAQIARIERERQPAVLMVGDLQAERDFLDVRDVAEAYARVILSAKEISPGTIMNICSGQPVRIKTVLDKLTALARKPITIEIDPGRLRKSDLPISFGDPTRSRLMLDWKPRYALQQTLSDVLEFQRQLVGSADSVLGTAMMRPGVGGGSVVPAT